MDIEWMNKAACLGMDINKFFPEFGEEVSQDVKLICSACPVSKDCYIFAERHYIDEGVFGGLSPRQRESRRKKTGRTSDSFRTVA